MRAVSIWRRVRFPEETEEEDCTIQAMCFDQQGRELAQHRKMHLFGYSGGGRTVFPRIRHPFPPGIPIRVSMGIRQG